LSVGEGGDDGGCQGQPGQLADWDRAHQQRIGDALDELPAADRTAIRAALPALARLVDQLADQRSQTH
jgi:hypothetical protein